MNANTVYLVIATFAQTGLLIWGLQLLSDVLRSQSGDNEATVARQMLSEKKDGGTNSGGTGTGPTGSFSRIAGAIGAIVLAAFFTGVSYWALFALFSDGNLGRLDELGTFFLVGSALFAPYAFNQLSGIFNR